MEIRIKCSPFRHHSPGKRAIGFHDLRHTSAKLLLAADVNLNVVQERLGHSQGRVFDFHALRHQFMSNLVRGGEHPKEVQSLARHSTITLTMDLYQ